jgi:hypothetical protein
MSKVRLLGRAACAAGSAPALLAARVGAGGRRARGGLEGSRGALLLTGCACVAAGWASGMRQATTSVLRHSID